MRPARDTLVMLLAGGVGSRLNILASRRAKPAVPFGGAYRIIDFTLSNVMHSGLERVGLLTQYKPFSLMDHVGGGEAWDMIGRERGIKILPPHTGEAESDWYKGTADAIYQNLWFVEDYRPDKVLVLSGDHIYRMDYERMIAAHESSGADLTIAAMPVPWEETQRFGVMVADGAGWITEFQEKVAGARSNLASMGIYVFDYRVLTEELRGVVGSRTGFDFGHDVIPAMLGRRKLLCYPFEGYWRDVGTIKSYLDANMDCLDPASGLDLAAWELCTSPDVRGRGDRPPLRLGSRAVVVNSLVARGSIIEGEVRNSVVFPGVVVRRGARLRDAVVMQDAVLETGCRVDYAILDKEVVVGCDAVVGEGDPTVANRKFPTHLECGITVLGKQCSIPPGMVIGKNCLVFPGLDLARHRGKRLADGETATG
ncbi:MAG: glucose-1-phosphate adenylyltransferase family protein [Acidobacteriota bacterium]